MIIGFDDRVLNPPLTGIAKVALTLKQELLNRNIKLISPRHLLPQKIENFFWQNNLIKNIYPLEKIFLEQINIFHSFWPFAPLPYAKNIKLIYTVHDLIPLHYPDSNTKKFFQNLKSAVSKADHIICVSEYTKKNLLNHFDLKKNKISVVYPGINNEFFSKIHCRDALQCVSTKNTKNKYLLTVGSILPHKNIQRLIDIYQENWPRLVICGSKRSELKINKKNIILTGYLKDEEIISLYDNALAFIFPSLEEGFGLPPLEAMARNCPVVSSNRASIPEILENSALFFDPEDNDDIKNKIQQIIDDKNLRKNLIIAGKKQVQKYTAKSFADRILKVYEDVLRG